MRTALLSAAAAGLLLAAAPVARAQDAGVKAIIDKAIQAHGGKEKLLKERAMRSKGKGTLEIMGLNLNIEQETAVQPPNKFKESVQFTIMGQNVSTVVAHDGKDSYLTVNGTPMDLPDNAKEELKEAMYQMRLGRLVFLQDKSVKLSPLGEVKVEGNPAVGIKVASEGHKDVNLYFDKDKGHLVKIEKRTLDGMTMQDVTEERIIKEYQEVEGLKVAKKVLVNRDGKKFMELEVTEVKFHDKIDDSEFAKP